MTSHTALARIIERLDSGAVAHTLVDHFRAEISGYQRLPTQVIEHEIFEIARHNIDLCFDSIVTGRELHRSEFEPFRVSARDRASEGMPLEDLLHAYRLGGRMGWRAITTAAAPEEQQSLIDAAELVMAYVDAVSAVVAQAYLEERQQLVSEEERGARDLFEALLRGGELGSGMQDLAEHLGFSLADTYQAFVAVKDGSGRRRHADLAASLRRGGTLALTEGERVAGLLPGGTRKRLAEVGGLVALGEAAPAGKELTQTVTEMRAVAELAQARGMDGVIHVADFPLELLLLAAPGHADRIASALAPLVPGSVPLLTLQVFLEEDLDRGRTAKRLHVHPNTLDYRLRRIRELTGLEPRDPEAITMFVLALKVRRLGL